MLGTLHFELCIRRIGAHTNSRAQASRLVVSLHLHSLLQGRRAFVGTHAPRLLSASNPQAQLAMAATQGVWRCCRHPLPTRTPGHQYEHRPR